MSVIWDLFRELYESIDDNIRSLENNFIVSSLWILFNGLILTFLIWLGFKIFANWTIGVWIIGILVGIEFLYWLGGHLQK
jgi:hypothetical protein